MKYINFSQLRSFHAVAQTRSITEASKLLRISQPTITKQLQLLEEFYSVSVINRHARGVTLTELGKSLFKITNKIFDLEEGAIELFSSDLNVNKGTLIIGASGTYYMMRLIKEFKKNYPSVVVRFYSSSSKDVLKQIIDQTIDISVIAKPYLKSFTEDIFSIPYLKQNLVLIVGKKHELYSRNSISMKELNGMDFIHREDGSETKRVFEEHLLKHGVEINIVMEAYRHSMIEAVAENMGIGVISEPEFHEYKGIKKIAFADADIYTEAYLVCLESKKNNNMIKAFIDASKKIINKENQ